MISQKIASFSLGYGTIFLAAQGINGNDTMPNAMNELLNGGVLAALVGILLWQSNAREAKTSEESAVREKRLVEQLNKYRDTLDNARMAMIDKQHTVLDRSMQLQEKMFDMIKPILQRKE